VRPPGSSQTPVAQTRESEYGRRGIGSCRRGQRPLRSPRRRSALVSTGASDSSASASDDRSPALASPTQSKQDPELEAQVVLPVWNVHQAVNNDADDHEQHAELERPPDGRAMTPPVPAGPDSLTDDPGEGRQP